jgi:hypothetical protein
MDYLGVGKPQVTVTSGSTTILATYTLPQPILNRITSITNFDLYMNASGKMVKKYANNNAERWEVTWVYKSQQLSQTDFNTILAIIDYERAGYTVTIKARSDNATITGAAILKEDPSIEAIGGMITKGYDISLTWIIDAVLVGYSQNLPDDFTIYDKTWIMADDYSEVGVYPTAQGATLYGGVCRGIVGDEWLTATYNAKTAAGTNSDELILRNIPDITRAAQLAGNAFTMTQDILAASTKYQAGVLLFDYDDRVNILVSQAGVQSRVAYANWQSTTQTYSTVTLTSNTLTTGIACMSVYSIEDDGVVIYDGYDNKFYTYDISGATFTLTEIVGQTVDKNSISSFPLYFIDELTAYEIDTTANKTYLVSVDSSFTVQARKELIQPDEIWSETYWLVNAAISGATEPYYASVSSPCFWDSAEKKLRVMALKSENVVGLPTNDYRNFTKIVTWSYKLT